LDIWLVSLFITIWWSDQGIRGLASNSQVSKAWMGRLAGDGCIGTIVGAGDDDALLLERVKKTDR
jgi:hypothetical protein